MYTKRYVLFSLFFLAGGYVIGVGKYLTSNQNFAVNNEYRGYIVKEVDRGVVAKVYTSSHYLENPRYIYVYCASKLCPSLYTDVIVRVVSVKAFGKYAGFGSVKRSELPTSSSVEGLYLNFLYLGALERLKVFNSLSQKYGAEIGSLGISMLIGETELSKELKSVMKDLGILHVIAISGVNITYLFLLVAAITKRLSRILRRIINYIVVLVLFFFVGESVSLFRAIATFLFVDIAKTIGLKLSGIQIVAFSFTVLLLLDQTYVLDVGFWLTLSACCGVYVLVPYISSRIKIKNSLLQEIITAIVVWIAVLPAQS